MSAPLTVPIGALLESDAVEAGVRLRRLLFINPRGDTAALIDVQSARALPEWVELPDLAAWLNQGVVRVQPDDPYAADSRRDCDRSAASRRIRDARFAVLQPLVDLEVNPWQEILHEEHRGRMLAAAAVTSGTSVGKLYKWLRLYWQRGQVPNALLPGYERCGAPGRVRAPGTRKRGAPSRLSRAEPGWSGMNVTVSVRERLVKGGRRFWRKQVRGKRLSLRQAFQRTLEVYFHSRLESRDGALVPVLLPQNELPTFRQFAYWLGKDRDADADLKARYSERQFALQNRPVLGSSEHLSQGPCGLYLIDATVADLYLLSTIDRSRVIGRPVLYLVVDHFSRMIVGYYVGLEGPSWLGAMMALENALTEKRAFCARFGVEIEEEDWPCHHVPRAVTGDRGEMIGSASDYVGLGFDLRLTNTPPYRADFKSFVEAQFKITNERGISRQPGWVDKLRRRGDRDYRKEAVHTLHSFNRLIIELILYNNISRELSTQVPLGYPLSRDAHPRPLDLWEWGMAERIGLGRTMERERVRVNLLPSVPATATHEGIEVHGLHYDSATGRKEGWFLRGDGRKRMRVEVAHDPRDVSKVYLRLERGRRIEECPLTPKDMRRWKGMTLEEVLDDRDRRDMVQEKGRRARHQAAAELHARLDQITGSMEAEREAALGGSGRQPSVTDIRQWKSAERRVQRAAEAFTRVERSPTADTPPPPVGAHPPAPAAEEDDEYVPFPD